MNKENMQKLINAIKTNNVPTKINGNTIGKKAIKSMSLKSFNP